MSFRSISLWLISLLAFQISALEINFEETRSACKMKVDPADISLEDDGMYYFLKNNPPVKISGLQFENGTYTALFPRGIIENIFGVWRCESCGYWNSRFDSVCTRCNRHK